ncbi:MAG: TagF domain-containing protein [Thermoanaerobaculia bacterium]
MGFDLLSPFRKRSADDPPPTESWPLFAFGKLPVYKDFISAGLTDDVSREFRDWLSNGFSRHWSSRDDCRSTEIPLHAFLLRLPESRKMAVGALWGSTDQGGLRKFPFALFTVLPAGKPAASVLTALDYLPVFESRAREIRRKYDMGGSLAAVYQELRGARIEIPVRKEEQIRVRLAEALARSRVGTLAKALFGDDAETQWAALLSGLDAAARRPAAGAAAFRFPLADGMVPLQQLKLWAVRLTKASPAGAGPTGVLYRTAAAAPCGVIFFRDARAEDILLFHPEAIPTDFVEEIPPHAHLAAAQTEVAGGPAAAAETPVVPPPRQPGPPVDTALPPEAAPPSGVPPVGEILMLGAAARTAETRPSGPPAAPAPDAAPESPAVLDRPSTQEPPAASADPAPAPPATPEPPAAADPVPEPPAAPDPPAVSESPAVVGPPPAPDPLAAPASAAPAADASPPATSPPAPLPHAEPAGWDLPLASLLEVG